MEHFRGPTVRGPICLESLKEYSLQGGKEWVRTLEWRCPLQCSASTGVTSPENFVWKGTYNSQHPKHLRCRSSTEHEHHDGVHFLSREEIHEVSSSRSHYQPFNFIAWSNSGLRHAKVTNCICEIHGLISQAPPSSKRSFVYLHQ